MMLLQLLLISLASATAILERDNLQEFDLESVRKSRRALGSNGCIRDTQTLDENEELQVSFHDVLNSFTENFNINPRKYCKTAAIGTVKSSKCIIDYSEFSEVEKYNKICSDARATLYPVSILVRCRKENFNDLDMELLNIPSCVGRSCDSGHLYLTLINILSGIETSMGGSGEEWNWKCTFYHDFESLKRAPATIIELPEDDDYIGGEATQSNSRGQSRGSNHQYMISLVTVIFVSGISFILH